MDMHYLEIFNVVAEQQSFTKAAEILHISQPALSTQVKRLEQQLGLKLFDKVKNRIFLNENGALLYEYTQKIFSLAAEAEYKLSNNKDFISGTLNIGASNSPGTYILPTIIGNFKSQYPLIKVNLHIGNTFEIYHLINNGSVDFAISGGNMCYNSNIHVEKLIDDELIFIASPQSPYSCMQKTTVKDLTKEHFIVHETDSQLYIHFKNILDELNLPENISMRLGSIDAIKQAVMANLGFSLLPKAAVLLELKLGLLKKLNIDDREWLYPYHLIYNKNRFISPIAIKFFDFVYEFVENKAYLIQK